MMKIVHAGDWDLPELDAAVAQACKSGEREASVTRLSVGGRVNNGYPDAHGDLQLDAAGRYYIVPSRPDQLEIAWEITGFENVEAADLQIYALDGTPLSFVSITEGRSSHETYGQPEGRRGSADTRFTFAGGPYLVRLRITRVRAQTKVINKARRLYFDVLPLAVIGGGIAGIRTAEKLLEADTNASVVILEARDYLGGRARTISWQGLAVDLGCQFLQDAQTNPLVDVATGGGDEVFWHKQITAVRVPVGDEIVEEDDERWEAADDRASFASCESGDESLQEALERRTHAEIEEENLEEDAAAARVKAILDDRLSRLAVAFSAELDEGSEASTFTSFQEPVEGGEEEEVEDVGPASNKMAVDGYGAVIEKHAQALIDGHPEHLTVLCEHAVSRVEVAEPLVKLTTPQGLLYASGVVVTVPTEIIRRGLITFSPALPAPIVQAFALLPMGHYKKIFLPLNEGSGVSLALAALVTPAARLAEGQTDASLFTITADGVPWKFLYRVSLNVVVAFLGGRHASALDARSDAQVAAEALAVLAAALGMAPEAVNASWTQHVLTSKWSTDPWSHGAYSYTRPEGGIAARTTLRTTLVHQRIVFAGEAVRSSKEEYATAHGAWLSGEDAARSILDALE